MVRTAHESNISGSERAPAIRPQVGPDVLKVQLITQRLYVVVEYIHGPLRGRHIAAFGSMCTIEGHGAFWVIATAALSSKTPWR